MSLTLVVNVEFCRYTHNYYIDMTAYRKSLKIRYVPLNLLYGKSFLIIIILVSQQFKMANCA